MTSYQTLAASAAIALCAGTLSAQAQNLTFSGGVSLTSNYMSRGVTQSENRPALQFYGEVEASGFYAGVWGSTVRFPAPETDAVELDLYAGYRFSVGAASFDVGYARYYYDDSGNCCGEFYGLFEIDADPATVFGGIHVDGARGNTLNDIHLGVSYGFAERYTTSLTAGRAAGGVRYGVLGLGYSFNDNFSVEAAYHVTNAQRNQLVVSASFDF